MTKEQSYPPTCIDCGTQNCKFKERTYPEFCLTTHLEQEDLEWALKQYNDNNKIMAASAEVEYEGYCRLICKVAGIAKSSIGIPKECEKIGAAMCNPILQARLLNQAHTELNVVIGLCVGHDSLFYKYSNAYTTTLVTKDRVTGHNPAAALYTANSYYRKKLMPEGEQSK